MKSDIAMFAKEVSNCALLGDSVAESILNNASLKLFNYAISLIKKIKKEDCNIGIYGGVFQNDEYVRNTFSSMLKEKYPHINIKMRYETRKSSSNLCTKE